MKFFAFIEDSIVEIKSKKTLYVLVVLSLLLIILCFSIAEEKKDLKDAISDSVNDVGLVYVKGKFNTFRNIECKLEDYEKISDTVKIKIRIGNLQSFNEAVNYYIYYKQKPIFSETKEKIEFKPPTKENKIDYLTSFFEFKGFNPVRVKQIDEIRYEVQLGVKNEKNLIDKTRSISLLFGLIKNVNKITIKEKDRVIEFKLFSLQEMIMRIQHLISETFTGFIAILLAIIATAGFLPGLLQKGSVELILSKPISRSQVLLYKYFGGLLYIFIIAAFVLGGCWLALSIRADFWNFNFLFTILTTTFLFAILYSVSVFIAVLWRSPLTSILLCILVWFLSAALCVGRLLCQQYYLKQYSPYYNPDSLLYKIINTAYYIFPKTTDIGYINLQLTTHSIPMTESSTYKFGKIYEFDPIVSVATNVAFIIFMLWLSCLVFKKKDY